MTANDTYQRFYTGSNGESELQHAGMSKSVMVISDFFSHTLSCCFGDVDAGSSEQVYLLYPGIFAA